MGASAQGGVQPMGQSQLASAYAAGNTSTNPSNYLGGQMPSGQVPNPNSLMQGGPGVGFNQPLRNDMSTVRQQNQPQNADAMRAEMMSQRAMPGSRFGGATPYNSGTPSYSMGGVQQQNYQGGGDVFSNAAAGLNQAMQGTQQGMNYQPMNVQAPMAYGQGYNASMAGAQGYNAANAMSQGYNAANVAGVSPITAQNVNAGQIAGTNLGAYTNPYESQVVQNSLGDIDRARQMQANELAAQAQKAGAFGGSRAALMQSELGRNALQQAAQTSAQLRQAGFQNAQQLAGQDIASRMQADLANQGANLQAQNMTGQFGMQAQLANQAAQNAAGQFGAGAFNTAALQNAAAQNQARQFGAGAFNTAGLQNAAAMNQAGQFNAGAMNTANLANQNALMQAQQLNQSAGLQGANMRLNAASQMGNLANLGFGMGQQTQAMQMQSGTIAQAINQALIDAAKGQYAGYTGAPAQSLDYMARALGATPNVSTTTATRNPGLFDYLTLGATAFGGK